MIKTLINKKVGPIGVDIGHSAIRMIQMGRSNSGMQVIAAQRCDIPADVINDEQARDEFIIHSLKRMRVQGHFKGRDVVSSLSNDSIRIKSLRISVTDDEQIQKLIRSDIAQGFGLDPDKDEIRYMVAGKVYHGNEVKNEVIFFGASRETIERHLNILEQAELQPTAIVPIPCAMLKCFQRLLRRQEDYEQTKVFIDIGNMYTTVIIGSIVDMHFIKQIPIGGNKIDREIAARLDISPEEASLLRAKLRNNNGDDIDKSTKQTLVDVMASVVERLAREISLCMKYYVVAFRSRQPEMVILTGGETSEKCILEIFKRHLGMNVEIAYPLRGVDISKTDLTQAAASSLSEWSVAVGLCVKEWNLASCGRQNNERN